MGRGGEGDMFGPRFKSDQGMIECNNHWSNGEAKVNRHHQNRFCLVSWAAGCPSHTA